MTKNKYIQMILSVTMVIVLIWLVFLTQPLIVPKVDIITCFLAYTVYFMLALAYIVCVLRK